MPKIIKEIKNIDILVNIKYKEEKDRLAQIFQFVVSNKKYLDYLFDKRFLFKNKIEKIINEIKLDNFITRVDSDNEVIMYYELQSHPSNIIRKIVCQVPPYTGCAFCDKAKQDGEFLFCTEKNKHYTKEGIKRCPVFHMKDVILT